MQATNCWVKKCENCENYKKSTSITIWRTGFLLCESTLLTLFKGLSDEWDEINILHFCMHFAILRHFWNVSLWVVLRKIQQIQPKRSSFQVSTHTSQAHSICKHLAVIFDTKSSELAANSVVFLVCLVFCIFDRKNSSKCIFIVDFANILHCNWRANYFNTFECSI